MKETLLKLIKELTGKLPPPLWAVYVYNFYLNYKKTKDYDLSKSIGQTAVDEIKAKISNITYQQESKFDYSLVGTPVLPGFGSAIPFIDPLLLAEVTCKSEKLFKEDNAAQTQELNKFEATQRTLTDAQRKIAKDWDDLELTPPAHLLTIFLENMKDESGLEVFLYGFIQAAVGAWAVKYAVKQARPSELIILLRDKKFESLIKTPTHPSCPSGHSTFSSIAAEIGDKFCKRPLVDPITNKSYNTWAEIADEAGISRIYGGIHFHKDNELGKELGSNIGKILLTNYKNLA